MLTCMYIYIYIYIYIMVKMVRELRKTIFFLKLQIYKYFTMLYSVCGWREIEERRESRVRNNH